MRRDFVKIWLIAANNDLKYARASLEELDSKFIYPFICFHSQQAAEKALKAFLLSRNLQAPKTHSLVDLLKLAAIHSGNLQNLGKNCEILDRYYVPTRYPDAILESKVSQIFGHFEAEEALKLASKIVKTISKVLQ